MDKLQICDLCSGGSVRPILSKTLSDCRGEKLRESECMRRQRGAFMFAHYNTCPRSEPLIADCTSFMPAFSTTFVRSSPDTRFPPTSSPHPPYPSSTNSLWRVQRLSSALMIDQSPKSLKSMIDPFSRTPNASSTPRFSSKEDGSQSYLGTPLRKPLPHSIQLFLGGEPACTDLHDVTQHAQTSGTLLIDGLPILRHPAP